MGTDAVGLHADADRVVVDLRRPAAYFLAVTASPSLAVVPPSMVRSASAATRRRSCRARTSRDARLDGTIHLRATRTTGQGLPALHQIDLVTDFGGTSGAQLFDEGQLDYAGIGGGDASWIAYDPNLGPQLRQTETFGVNYYGFNTNVAPFDKAQVRLAFAEAVNWNRIVTLAGRHAGDVDDSARRARAATMPITVPRTTRPTQRRCSPQPALPDGANFPTVTLATYGVGYEQTVANELHDNLGVTVDVEALDFQDYLQQVGLGRRTAHAVDAELDRRLPAG